MCEHLTRVKACKYVNIIPKWTNSDTLWFYTLAARRTNHIKSAYCLDKKKKKWKKPRQSTICSALGWGKYIGLLWWMWWYGAGDTCAITQLDSSFWWTSKRYPCRRIKIADSMLCWSFLYIRVIDACKWWYGIGACIWLYVVDSLLGSTHRNVIDRNVRQTGCVLCLWGSTARSSELIKSQ